MFSTVGPKAIPASSSPTTAGCFNRTLKYPPTFVKVTITVSANMNCRKLFISLLFHYLFYYTTVIPPGVKSNGYGVLHFTPEKSKYQLVYLAEVLNIL